MNKEHSDQPSMQPAAVKINPGFAYSDSERSFQGIPGIEVAPNGRLWATWYSGGPEEGSENYVVLTTSGDGGRHWSPVKLVIDPPGKVRAFDPTLWHDPLGRLWLFWAQSHDLWDGRGGVWAMVTEDSGNENATWSKPRRLANGIMMNKPIVRANGEWLMPSAVWKIPVSAMKKSIPADCKYYLPESETMGVYASNDQGKTWSLRGGAVIPVAPQELPYALLACEHMLIERKDQSLWMLVRTTYGIGESESRDGGKTWSVGKPSSIPHVCSRFFIRRLKSGRLLLVRHDSPGIEKEDFPKYLRNNMKAFLSDDDGKTWYGGLLLDERETVSYPDGAEGPDGVIYVIYDFERSLSKEIYLAAFSEDDIRAGRNVSGKLRLQVLVNRATGTKYSPQEYQEYLKHQFE